VAAHPGSLLRVFQQAPCPVLRPIIKRFLVIEFPSFYSDAHLPETDAVAAFSFRGACRINETDWAPAAAFTGPRDTLRAHEHREGHAVLLATFTPVGAYTVVRSPLHELAGFTVGLAELVSCSEELHQLSEQLDAAIDHRQRVALVEHFLLARLSVSGTDPLITAAVAWLEQGTTSQRMDDLTRYIGLSQSALERRFRRIVGVSPKKYASLMRLRRAVRLQETGVDLTTVAHTAGYFDQSHFIKDFRRATGSAPSSFFGRNSAE
jgi:AraC-like DNA-binding protein